MRSELGEAAGGPRGNVLLLGSAGGVATALLNLLVRHPAGRRAARAVDRLLLLDSAPTSPPAGLERAEVLPRQHIGDTAQLDDLIRAHRVDQIIELADVETFAATVAAAEAGTDYLCTGYESRNLWPELEARLPNPWNGDGSPGADRGEWQPRLDRGSHVMGSGMNPGVVNALVGVAMERFGEICGVAGQPEELDLYAILFTEIDTSRELGGAATTPRAATDPIVFPMTWHPGHCLYEVLNDAVYMDRGRVRVLDHPAHRALYRARCGADVIGGMIVRHEEVYTIGARFPGLEVGYVYRLLPAAHRLLLEFPERGPKDWPARKLYPPEDCRLEGSDRVGVLLCSRTHGELWLGFENHHEEGVPYGTNATLLQVAAGVLAGWSQLGERAGVRLVEELDRRRYLEIVESILGAPTCVHDSQAPPRSLPTRRVDAAQPATELRQRRTEGSG